MAGRNGIDHDDISARAQVSGSHGSAEIEKRALCHRPEALNLPSCLRIGYFSGKMRSQ